MYIKKANKHKISAPADPAIWLDKHVNQIVRHNALTAKTEWILERWEEEL